MNIRRSSYDPFAIESALELRDFNRNLVKDKEEKTRRLELTAIVERMMAQEKLKVSFKVEALYQTQCCEVCDKKQTVFRGLFKVKQNGLRTAEQINLSPDHLSLIAGCCVEKIGAYLCHECAESIVSKNLSSVNNGD